MLESRILKTSGAALLVALLLPLQAFSAAKTKEGTVAYVVDGDTLVLDDGTTVHYIGVQAPAHSTRPGGDEPYGRESFALNKKLVAGKIVRLELDARERDNRGNLLAYVYVGKYFVNASLVQSGYAKVAIQSPNTRFAALFERLQAEARTQRKGLWKMPQVAAPTFGNHDLSGQPSAAPAKGAVAKPGGAKIFENRDLEPFDIPGEPEGPPPSADDEEGAKGGKEATAVKGEEASDPKDAPATDGAKPAAATGDTKKPAPPPAKPAVPPQK